MKSKLIKIAGLAFVGLLVYLVVINPQSETDEGIIPQSPTPTTKSTYQGTDYDYTRPTPTLTFEKIPETGKVKVDGVDVNNFLIESDPSTVNIETVYIQDSESYEIMYINRYNQFLISIEQSPFDIYRKRAEGDFLRKMDISQGAACKLNVVITTPRFANPDEAGNEYPLSFCE